MKYVLISQQGTGTNLLRAFLNSHPNVLFDRELFSPDVQNYKNSYKNFASSIEQYLNGFYRRGEKAEIGFDLKYGQMDDKYKDVLEYLLKNDVGVIHLSRNPGRTFLRYINKENRTLRYEHLIEHCEMVEMRYQQVRKMFGKGKYIELRYEDMTRGLNIESLPEDFERRVLKWLGVSYRKLHIDTSFAIRTDKLKIRY